MINSSCSELINKFKNKALWVSDSDVEVSKKAHLLAVALMDKNESPVMKIPIGEKLFLKVLYRKNAATPLHLHMVLKNRFNQIVFSGGTYTLGIDVSLVQQGDLAFFEFIIDCMLEAGEYIFMVKIAEESVVPNRGIEVDASPWLGPLTIQWNYETQKAPFLGMFGLPCKGRTQPVRTD